MKVWDAQTGQELLYPQGAHRRVNGVAFSPDGKRLASAAGSGDGDAGRRDEGVGCRDRPGAPHPQGSAGPPAWPSARTASGWRVASQPIARPIGVRVKSRCGMRRPARSSSPSRGTPATCQQRGLQPGRQAPGQQRRVDQHGEGVGCADRPGTPHPQSGRARSIAWRSARTATGWSATRAAR